MKRKRTGNQRLHNEGEKAGILPLFPEFEADLSLGKNCRKDDCILPAAGNRNGTGVSNVGTNGNYWSSTANNSTNAYNVNFNDGNFNAANNNNRYNGFSVRLAQDFIAQYPNLQTFLNKLQSRPHLQLTKRQLMTLLVKAYHDARKHKRKTVNQLKFEVNQEKMLVRLCNEIWKGTYKPGRSTAFIVKRPHTREVFAATFYDRVVHHLLYNMINPMLEQVLSLDCYSCRKGKGTLYGINRLEHHIRSVSENYHKSCYVLQMDLTGYFMNIRRETLLERYVELLEKMTFRKCTNGRCTMYDGRCVMEDVRWADIIDVELCLFLGYLIIMHDPTKNCLKKDSEEEWAKLPAGKSLYKTPEGCGMPIGNLTSQMFSNLYLMPALQFIQRHLRLTHSGHYVDDFFAVHGSREVLEKALPAIQEFLETRLGAHLNRKKTKIVDAYRGVAFLGAYLLPYRRYIERDSLKRMHYHLIQEGALQNEVSRKSTEGTLVHYNAYRLSCKLFREEGIYEQVFWSGIAA